MNDEEGFQAALDANPEDHVTRLVFADWLDERGDPRAEGYRALGALRRVTWFYSGIGKWGFFSASRRSDWPGPALAELPDDWVAVKGFHQPKHPTYSKEYRTRREAEDAAALAFARLPPERRAELLAGAAATSG